MNNLAAQFRDAVQAYIERTGTPPARLGQQALGDPSFVLRLRRGRIPRLDTADKVLAFIGEQPLGPAFRAEIEAFIEITRTKPYVLGLDAAGDPSFVARLRRGVSPRLDTVSRVRGWMATRCNAAERAAIRALAAGEPRPPRRSKNTDGDSSPTDNNEGGTSMSGQSTRYLGTREAAAFLGLSPRTLDRYRVTGEGPAFHKFGSRILYAQADLEEWAAARRMTSTSDDRAAGRRVA